MYKKIINIAVITIVAGVFFSGCTLMTKYDTTVMPSFEDKALVTINVNQDSTSAGFIMSGSVVRTNYMYSFGVAAQAAKDAGYTHFSIIGPDDFLKQLLDRNVKNVQEAYDACNSGSGSFAMGLSYRKFMEERNNCDSIVRVFNKHTLFGGTVVHKPVSFNIKLHNEPVKSNYTFNAADVLSSSFVKGLNHEYFKNINR